MSTIGVLQNYRRYTQDSSVSESDTLGLNWKEGLIVALLIWSNTLSAVVNGVVWIALIIWSLTGTSRAVRAILLGYVLFSLNPVYEPFDVNVNEIKEVWRFVNDISAEIPEPVVMQEEELLKTVANLKHDMDVLKKTVLRKKN